MRDVSQTSLKKNLLLIKSSRHNQSYAYPKIQCKILGCSTPIKFCLQERMGRFSYACVSLYIITVIKKENMPFRIALNHINYSAGVIL